MRMSRKQLLALPAAVGLAFAFAVAHASAAPPASSYTWGQPGCAPVVVPCAQPPAGVPTAPAAVEPPVTAGSDYAWAQPGTAPVEVPLGQPPAWIPA